MTIVVAVLMTGIMDGSVLGVFDRKQMTYSEFLSHQNRQPRSAMPKCVHSPPKPNTNKQKANTPNTNTH